MSKLIFQPAVSVIIPADSSYHGDYRKLKISVGIENDKVSVPVYKVQMVQSEPGQKEKVMGRQAPSFTRKDRENVQKAWDKIDSYLDANENFYNPKTGFNGSDILI
jgi:hypothetical protein